MATTTSFPTFAATTNDPLPRKACLGFVEDIKDGTITQKGVYAMIQMVIAPVESGQKAYVNFLFRPEWLEPGFDAETIKDHAEGEKMYAVYRMHVGGARDKVTGQFTTVPTIAGVLGSEERFSELAGRVFAIEGGKTPEAVTAALREVVNEHNPEVGYILREKKELSPITDKKEPTGKYEVGEWYFPTEGKKQQLAKQAAAGRLILTFEV